MLCNLENLKHNVVFDQGHGSRTAFSSGVNSAAAVGLSSRSAGFGYVVAAADYAGRTPISGDCCGRNVHPAPDLVAMIMPGLKRLFSTTSRTIAATTSRSVAAGACVMWYTSPKLGLPVASAARICVWIIF